MKSSFIVILTCPLIMTAFLSPGKSSDSAALQLIMTAPECVWTDTSNMNLQLTLVNNSRQPVQVFDQILDDMYNEEELVSNIQFLIERKEGNSFRAYRAIICQFRIPDLNKKILTTKDLLDSVLTIRNAMIRISPGESLQSSYSFSIGRVTTKGKYRVKALFDSNMCERYSKFTESNWVFFELAKDIELVSPYFAYQSGRQFFWTKKQQ